MAVWRTSDDWIYETFSIDASAREFRLFEPFVNLWNSKRTGRALPTWKDYRFEEFAGWYGWVTVEDIIPGDRYDARYRLWGTKVAELFEIELTGKRMSDAPPEFYDDNEFDLYQKLVDDVLITISGGPLKWQNRVHKTISTIDLPLSENGKDVDQLISLTLDVTPKK
jgi:hypothetical protein